MASLKTAVCACIVLALTASAAPLSAQTRLPIAYLNVQTVIKEAAATKAATAALTALRAARTEELTAKKKVVDATKLELANAGGYFSSAKRARLQVQLRAQEADLQQANHRAQTELEERQRTLNETLRSELSEIVTAIATQRGFQYVLNQEAAVILAPQGADLTAEVLERLNAAEARRSSEKK